MLNVLGQFRVWGGLGSKKSKSPGVAIAKQDSIMFTAARDFLLETPWRIIIPNPNVNSHSL
jgi:hypothetical protein